MRFTPASYRIRLNASSAVRCVTGRPSYVAKNGVAGGKPLPVPLPLEIGSKDAGEVWVHGYQPCLIELCFAHRQDRVIQIHIPMLQANRFPDAEAGPIEKKDQRPDGVWFEMPVPTMSIFYDPDHVLHVFHGVEVGSELSWILGWESGSGFRVA